MLVSPKNNGLDSLCKEVRALKETPPVEVANQLRRAFVMSTLFFLSMHRAKRRARQSSGEGVARRNGRPKGCFWRVRFLSAPLRFALKTLENLKGAKEKRTLQNTLSDDRFSALFRGAESMVWNSMVMFGAKFGWTFWPFFCLETPHFHVQCPRIVQNCSCEREHCHSHAFFCP